MYKQPKDKKFINMTDRESEHKIYRVIFECSSDDYESIIDEITAYGAVLDEEIEVDK